MPEAADTRRKEPEQGQAQAERAAAQGRTVASARRWVAAELAASEQHPQPEAPKRERAAEPPELQELRGPSEPSGPQEREAQRG